MSAEHMGRGDLDGRRALVTGGASGNQPGQPQAFDLDTFPIVEMPDAAHRRIMSVNVDGVVFGTRALVPAMFDADRGDIVVTATMVVWLGVAAYEWNPALPIAQAAT